MMRRLHVNNFRCLTNFELSISGLSSVLLIGRNGSGKTTVGLALEILQLIARGTNRIDDLVKLKDLGHRSEDLPMRFEIDVELGGKVYEYSIAFSVFPNGFKELSVFEEKLSIDGKFIYTRIASQVRFENTNQETGSGFLIDQHLVALPIIHEQSTQDPLFIFKRWLSHMLIIRPTPSLILGDSDLATLQPNLQVTNLGAWFSGLVTEFPAAYSGIDEFLKQVMPDFKGIKNSPTGRNSRSLEVQFSTPQGSLTLPFEDLSDGEKSFMICALVIAANYAYGPLLCFWDEPDNYLALDEVQHFVLALRRAFRTGGQFIATSHNPEAIRSFSDENTLFLYMNSHLEPTIVRSLEELRNEGTLNGDLVGALSRGDVGP